MKRITCISIILILSLTTLTCFSQNRIRISRAKTVFLQADIKGGFNYASLGKDDKNRYICEILEVKLKQQILENQLYVNGGLSIEGNRLANAVINNDDYSFKFDYTAIGIPLSAELSCLNNPRFSLYATLGFAPTFCFAGNIEKDGVAQESRFNVLITPRAEGGAYVSIGYYKLAFGIFAQRHFALTNSDEIVFLNTGRTFLGASLGFIF